MPASNYSTDRDSNASIAPGNIRSEDYRRDQQIINAIRQLMADLASMTAGDDTFYDHGDWIPTVEFGGNSVGITYTTQRGRYIKIGKLVFAEFEILLSSKGSSTGTSVISGLPFANSTTRPFNIAVGYYENMALTAAGMSALGYGDDSGFGIVIRNNSTTVAAAANDTHWTNSSRIIAGGTYEAA